MKKTLSTLCLSLGIGLVSVSLSVASVAPTNQDKPTTAQPTPGSLNLDQQRIDAEFEQLNKLEDYINQHPGTTLEDLRGSELTKDLKLEGDATLPGAKDDLPGNIPAFWWGCVLGWVGILLVYLLTDKDKEQTKKALYGCLVWVGVWLVFWLVYVVALGNAWFLW